MSAAHRRRDALLLLGILVLAALLRLPGLDQRGRWDADQGHDMLVLRALVRDGEVPLLGPPTSIARTHHGALYYYLLAPAAWVSDADPVVVTGWIALLGVAAAGAAWSLARSVAGSIAGHAAGLLTAVSPAGIDESTFIWNPNPIPLAAGIAAIGVVRAWQTGRARWWLLAATGTMAVSQLHILGVVFVPAVAAAFLLDVRRATPARRRALARVGTAAVLVLAAGYLPLLVHELQSGFTETVAVLAYLREGSGPSSPVPVRIGIVAFRSVGWPLAGLVTEAPGLASVATLAAVALAAVAWVRAGGSGRFAVRWLAATFAWSAVALAVAAPSLTVAVPGLPNDHYHAFLDPVVIVLAAAGTIGVARLVAGRRADGSLGALAGGAALALLVGIAVVRTPPEIAGDGGWRLVDQAAGRVAASVGQEPFLLGGIPGFKRADALGFPLVRRGLVPVRDDVGLDRGGGAGATAEPSATRLVVVCDPLFDEPVGAACGGPAEAVWLESAPPGPWRLEDRFSAGSRRVISVWAAEAGP